MMSFIKFLCKKFSCSSNCKYNSQLEHCPKESMHKIRNIDNLQLSMKDVLKIMKIIDKKPIKNKSITNL